jgi:phosphatidylglycerophosphatase A
VNKPAPRQSIDLLALWIAQGFGIGRIPFAPGTFGSLVGFVWFFLLLAFGDELIFIMASAFGIGLSVWSAGRAEKLLGQTDPGSVVIDEIVAIPLCFVGLMLANPNRPEFYHPGYYQRHLGILVAVFIAFRVFDIWKPWPINRTQALPGGWGVTIDDAVAAAFVNLIWLAPGFRT